MENQQKMVISLQITAIFATFNKVWLSWFSSEYWLEDKNLHKTPFKQNSNINHTTYLANWRHVIAVTVEYLWILSAWSVAHNHLDVITREQDPNHGSIRLLFIRSNFHQSELPWHGVQPKAVTSWLSIQFTVGHMSRDVENSNGIPNWFEIKVAGSWMPK